ncbi:hypothetical protein [Kribbella ginsengisoli]|uniref:Uncharacterized protein n=1 Tax=Kribbella ginsengisoli TaxID=363865 RepID=A0ABP6YLG8_9ACTN
MGARTLVAGIAAGALVVGVGVWYFALRHDGGPLSGNVLGDAVCLSVGETADATIGNLPLRNTGSDPITITAVSVIGPDGVEDDGALLVPVSAGSSSGSKTGWAFGNGPFDGENGAPALAVGAQLQKSADTRLIVHVHRPDPLAEARLTGIRVEYRSGLRHYAREMGPRHTLRPGRCS